MVEFGRVPRCAICNEPGAMYVVFFGGVGGKADKNSRMKLRISVMEST